MKSKETRPSQVEISEFEGLPPNLDSGTNTTNEFAVTLDGYEGPLNSLLTLARKQKVDLASISILALAEQYLAFISEAHRMRLELAADYLVMAAWLTYLKSRLLLPKDEATEEYTPEELEEALKYQLL